VVRSTYIVQVQEGFAAEVRASIGRLGETPHDELTEVMDGFVIDLTDTEVAALRLEPYVVQVVADAPMFLMDTQSPTPSWGLDRIDQTATAGDNAYNYPSNGGAGVRVYVVDTGVMATNPDFAGRMLPGADMLGQNLEAADCQGHGTHVAGTVAGTKYGVAKKASIVPVRVLSCTGSGSWSYFISAMDWIIANNPAGTPAVMSASLGGGNYPLANAAVEKLYAAGITPVIAAGNSNIDACGTSPAGAPNAITVGATDINDARASYSNWGECVDVFAPGSQIVSDSHLDPTGSRSLSGTSMATPHVSGLAALYLAANPTATPAQVTSAIKAGGLAGVVANAQSTLGNILANNTFTRASVPVAPAPVYPPTGVAASAISSTGATISWTAPAVSAAATAPESYKVEYRVTTETVWQSVTTTATSVGLTGLLALNNYVVRVTSIAGAQSSAPSAELQFSTLGTPPAAPSNLISTAIYGNQIDLAWTAPNSNGSPIIGYYLEQSINGTWTRIATPYGKSWSVTKLVPVTAYSFRIQAYNSLGAGQYSNELAVTTTQATPATPTGIVISNITATTVTATWKASAQVDLSVPITYQVNIYSRQIYNFGALLGSYTSSTNAFVVPNLKRTTAYSIGIKAISGTAISPQSALVSFTTAASKPTAPTTPTLSKSATAVTITWMGPADNGGSAVTGYLVDKRNLDGTWTNIANQTAMTIEVPIPAKATTDFYRVSAVNAIGVSDPLAINISTQADLPGAPQGLTLTRGTSSSVLNWAAPTTDGGAPITYYAVYRSADNGTTWVTVNQAITSTSFIVGLPSKGVKYLYAVAAKNSTGFGARSTTVSDETLATAPTVVRSLTFGYPTSGKLQISWLAPADNGGSPITAYRLERQLADGSWTVLNETAATSFQIDRDLPGVLVTIRVTAINAIGASPLAGAAWRTPYTKATAPQNFTAVDNGSVVATTWVAPTDLGGSAISYYQVQISRDSGTTWASIATAAANASAVNATRPTKGQTWIYRVVAFTGFGASDASNTVTISSALTVPGAPMLRSVTFATDGSINVAWMLPADNGGSAITSIVVEKSSDNVNWTATAPLAANAVLANFARELPGVRAYFRVKAVNSVGTSAASSVGMMFTPYVKASAPQNVTATDVTSAVNVNWSAPAELGGSTVSQYLVQYSRDNGTTWLSASYVSSSSVTARVVRPAKGQTWLYRVIARTGAGDSLPSTTASITVATTVPSSPGIRSLVVNPDTTLTATWNIPGDNGGTAITGFVVERSADNITWTALPALAANVTSVTVPTGVAGTKVYLRVSAVNAVGASALSNTAYYMVPFQKASAPLNLTATVSGSRVVLNWQAPANTGGSAVSQYAIEYSANGGASWILTAYSYTLTANVGAAPKGQSFSYRVTARTSAGLGAASNVVSVATPTTVTSALRLNSAVATGPGAFNLTFSAPADLGGVASYNYRVELLGANGWATVASGTGAAVNVVALTTANRTTIFTYRVIATNSVGDSVSTSFNFRG
jgi:hypothetical protein